MEKGLKSVRKSNLSHFNSGIKDGLPIGLGYLSVSFAFGVQAVILGLPAFMAVFMSMTNLTSAGQLAGLTVITALGSIIEIILTQLVINARYFLMSLSLSQKLDENFSLPNRLFFSIFITDEIFAVASSKKSAINKRYFYGLIILPYLGWTVGTLLGATAGNLLPPLVVNSLGIALYAMFIAIIVPPSIKERGILFSVATGASLSAILYFIPVFSIIPTGFKIIISAIITACITAWLFPLKGKEVNDNATD